MAPPLVARLVVECAGWPAGANLSAPLGLNFHSAHGFGESVGEAVISLQARCTGCEASHDYDAVRAASSADADAAIGPITITNNLQAGSTPAVLAPITDQLGIFNWDFGELGVWHDRDASNGKPGPADGVLDPTRPPFSADATGATDATLALQAAIEFSRDNYLALWLPAGQ